MKKSKIGNRLWKKERKKEKTKENAWMICDLQKTNSYSALGLMLVCDCVQDTKQHQQFWGGVCMHWGVTRTSRSVCSMMWNGSWVIAYKWNGQSHLFFLETLWTYWHNICSQSVSKLASMQFLTFDRKGSVCVCVCVTGCVCRPGERDGEGGGVCLERLKKAHLIDMTYSRTKTTLCPCL